MRGKSMILIVIALGCGLVASIGISQILDGRGSGGPKVETRKIYVAVKDVDISHVLDAETIKLEEWPIEKIPEGAVVSLDEVKGLMTNQRLFSGEPIRKEKLVDPMKKGGESARIPAGYRVQAIKVQPQDVVGNLIAPGDHVDVQVYLRKGGNIPDTITKTFLEDVRVFAVNQTTSRDQDEEGNKINAKTISLLLKPAQVEEMLLASRLGQISLSLRRPDDQTMEDTKSQGTRIGSLLRGQAVDGTPESGAKPNVPQAAPAKAAADFTAWLNSVTADNAAEPAHDDSGDQVASAYWQMQLLTPAGVTNIEVANTDSISVARTVTGDPSAGQVPPSANVPSSTHDFDAAPLADEPASTDADAGHDDGASPADGDDSAAGDDSTTDSASGEEAGLDS